MTAPPGTQRHRFGIPRTKHRAGFTLIELLTVVVVIGPLARIGSQRYWGYLDRVKVAKAIGESLRALGADSVSLTAETSANTTLAMLEIPSGRPVARGVVR